MGEQEIEPVYNRSSNKNINYTTRGNNYEETN